MTVDTNKLNRFINEYYPESGSPRATVPGLPIPIVESLLKDLLAANAPLRDALLPPAAREDMRGKNGPLLPTLLTACRKGLLACPTFAARTQTSAEGVAELAEQQMAAAADVKILEGLRERLDGCWYAIVGAAQDDAQALAGVLGQIMPTEGDAGGLELGLAAVFARPLQLHQQGLDKKRALTEMRADKGLVADQQAQGAAERAARRQDVHDMLADFSSGKGPLKPVIRGPIGAPRVLKGEE